MKQLGDVKTSLRKLGASPYHLMKPEVIELAKLLLAKESVLAFAQGVYPGGWGMIVATNRRILVIDKMPRKVDVDDIPYTMVAGTETDQGLRYGQLRLFTRPKNFTFRWVRNSQIALMRQVVDEQVAKARPLKDDDPVIDRNN